MKESTDEINNPWGIQHSISEDLNEKNFEDSFSDSFQIKSNESNYIPLDDSQQYLASLEKKLAGIQGRTQSKRENERKRLISALAQSKETHTVNFLEGDDTYNEDISQVPSEQSNISLALTSGNAIDPQGAMGYFLKKCAPDHVAVSAEEVCELLKSDILAKVFEELQIDDQPLNSQEQTPKIEQDESVLCNQSDCQNSNCEKKENL